MVGAWIIGLTYLAQIIHLPKTFGKGEKGCKSKIGVKRFLDFPFTTIGGRRRRAVSKLPTILFKTYALVPWAGHFWGCAQLFLMMITRIAEYYRNVIKAAVPERYPFVGTGFNITSAGIHADGLSKDERIYNVFDTRKFLDRPPRVAITDKSGVDGIANWVNE